MIQIKEQQHEWGISQRSPIKIPTSTKMDGMSRTQLLLVRGKGPASPEATNRIDTALRFLSKKVKKRVSIRFLGTRGR
jgi:hypothetical protein